MRYLILVLLLIFGLLGCVEEQPTKYECPNGTIVLDPYDCLPQEEKVDSEPVQTEASNEADEIKESPTHSTTEKQTSTTSRSDPSEQNNQEAEYVKKETATENPPDSMPEEPEVLQDKCSHIEKQTLLDLCYEQKYFEPAIDQQDASVCDEIVMSNQLGLCYAKVAYAIHNPDLCNSVKKEYYTSTSYYDQLNSREVCFYYYVFWHEKNYLNFKPEYCSRIENLQLRTECEELDEEYYEYPSTIELYGAKKEGNSLGIQLGFTRGSYYSAYGEKAIEFQETNLNGELTYQLSRRLEGGSMSYLSDKVDCNKCKDELSSLLVSDSLEISRSEFDLYVDSDSKQHLLYPLYIPLSGIHIDDEVTCYDVEGEDYFPCTFQCSAEGLTGSELEDCQEGCDDEKVDINCPVEYYVEIEVEGENGDSYEVASIIPQILD